MSAVRAQPAPDVKPATVTEALATTETGHAGDAAPLHVSAGTPVTLPALTPVYLRLDEGVSSNQNKPGDRFRILVAEDVRVGDVVVIPLGSVGEGEVVHAARSSAGGKAGELILAARFVRVDGREVRLRSLALGAAGRDHTNEALATSFIAGPFAMFVRGGVMLIPRDTIAGAKTAEEIQLPAREAMAPAAAPPPVDTTREGEEDESKTT
jgi:hypothetical protein